MRDKASHNMPDVVQDTNEDALCCQWFSVQHLQLEGFSAGWSPTSIWSSAAASGLLHRHCSLHVQLVMGLWPKRQTWERKQRREQGIHTFQLAYSQIAPSHVISIKTQLNDTFRRPFWQVTLKRNIPPETGVGNILCCSCKDLLCIMTNAVYKEID